MSNDEKHHQYTASSKQWEKLKPSARHMRHKPTSAEDMLWQQLRNRQVMGQKFRRQHAVHGFIADFACIERFLIIEVDGEIHDQPEHHERDIARQAVLEAHGFKVLRFTNAEVMGAIQAVLARIEENLTP